MKKWLWVVLVVVVLILLSCQKEGKTISADMEKGQSDEISQVSRGVQEILHSAMKNLEAGNASEGASLLIDAVLLTHPQEETPGNFYQTLTSAKNYFQSQDFREASRLVSGALVLFESGLESKKQSLDQMSAKVSDAKEAPQIFPLAQKVKENIMKAIEEFEIGNSDKGVVLILQSLELFGPPAD